MFPTKNTESTTFQHVKRVLPPQLYSHLDTGLTANPSVPPPISTMISRPLHSHHCLHTDAFLGKTSYSQLRNCKTVLIPSLPQCRGQPKSLSEKSEQDLRHFLIFCATYKVQRISQRIIQPFIYQVAYSEHISAHGMHKDSLLLVRLGIFLYRQKKICQAIRFFFLLNYKGKTSQEVKALQTQQLLPVPLSPCSVSLRGPELFTKCQADSVPCLDQS